MQFEWDERKNQQNRRKHHIDFDEAKEIFNFTHFTEVDQDGSEEIRETTIGQVGTDTLLVVVHTERRGKIE